MQNRLFILEKKTKILTVHLTFFYQSLLVRLLFFSPYIWKPFTAAWGYFIPPVLISVSAGSVMCNLSWKPQ